MPMLFPWSVEGSSDAASAPTPQHPFDDQAERAFAKILKCAQAKERSSAQMRRLLLRSGFEEHDVEAAITRAMQMRVIDDARYADHVTRSALARGRGMRPVADELRELDVDIHDVDAYQECLASDGAAMEDRAFDALMQRPVKAKDIPRACMRRLLSKGYTESEAEAATHRYLRLLSEHEREAPAS